MNGIPESYNSGVSWGPSVIGIDKENKVLKTKNIVDVAIKEYFNKEDVTVISKTLEENDISTDKIVIKRTDNEVGVNIEYEMSSLFGKIVGLQKYDVKVKRKGIKENGKIKITEE